MSNATGTQVSSSSSGPQSLVNRSFTNLADLNDSVLSDDYVYGAFETWKFKGKTTGNGKWDYKGKVKDLKKGLDSELKIQFPYNRYWFWIGLRGSGDVKVHVDLGDVSLGKKSFNLFTNIKTNDKFSLFNWRFGANFINNHYESNTRIETNTKGSGYSLTQRNLVRRNNFFYAGVGTFALDQLTLQRLDAILGLNRDNLNLYLKFETGKGKDKCSECPFPIPGQATLTGIFSKNKNVFGAEFSHGIIRGNQIQVAAQSQVNDKTTIKARLNQNFDLALALKHKLNKTLNLTASAQLQLSKGAQAIDLTSLTPVPFGVQFELNI